MPSGVDAAQRLSNQFSARPKQLFVQELSSVALSSGSAHEHEQTPPRMACYLIRMPEFVSDIFGAVNENKKKQQLQQKPATAEATGAGADMST